MFVVPKSTKIDMKTKNLNLLSFATIVLMLVSTASYSQVGIGTTEPQETLHVAGESSTIRIEGLDSNNNTENNGSRTPLAVDALGNMVLGRSSTHSGRFQEYTNILSTPIYTETGVKYGSSASVLYTITINPEPEDRLIIAYYQVSVVITEEGEATKKLSKNHEAKLYGARIRVNNSVHYANDSNTFTSDNKYWESNPDFLSGQALIFLAANTTHTIDIVGYVRNSDDSSGLRATFGGAGQNDRVQIFEMF
jgi:hypothetical protein